jgi:hypothetical protein
MAGNPPCNELAVELALELIEAELAVELPAHMRGFARAHADGRPPPPAPELTRRASTVDTARNACTHPRLADRGIALLRRVAPIVIESDPAVVAARSERPSWPGLARLAAARDQVAHARFGCTAIELVHRLSGVASVRTLYAPGPPIDGWQVPDVTLDHAAVQDVWKVLAARVGVAGMLRIDRTASASPRAFVIEPKVEAIVVVPASITSPAARFAVLHELGHAIVALSMRPGVPRVVDEAAAAYVARLAEPPSWLPPKWPSALAVAARSRRLALASMLDDIERRLPDLSDTPGTAPPWALWHDPGAQASYVEAEDMADRLRLELGPNPPPGQLVRALIAERDLIDQQTRF